MIAQHTSGKVRAAVVNGARQQIQCSGQAERTSVPSKQADALGCLSLVARRAQDVSAAYIASCIVWLHACCGEEVGSFLSVAWS